MLPTDTITLTDGTTPEEFSSPVRLSDGMQYSSPSPQGDILGRAILTIRTSKTKSGVERTVIQLSRPIWDDTLKKYAKYRNVQTTVSRKGDDVVVEVEKDIKKITSIPTDVLSAIASGQL